MFGIKFLNWNILFGPEHPNIFTLFGHKNPNRVTLFGHKNPNIFNLFGPQNLNRVNLFRPERLYISGTLLVPKRKKFHKSGKYKKKKNIETDLSTPVLIEMHHSIFLFFLHCTRKMEWKKLSIRRRKDEGDGGKWVS